MSSQLWGGGGWTILEESLSWEGVLAVVPPPPAPSEQGEAPGTGTGRTWSSHHPSPRSISGRERLIETGWLVQ